MLVVAKWNYPDINQTQVCVYNCSTPSDPSDPCFTVEDINNSFEQPSDMCWMIPGTITNEELLA